MKLSDKIEFQAKHEIYSVCCSCGTEHDGHIPGVCPSCGDDSLLTMWGDDQARRWREGRRTERDRRDGPSRAWIRKHGRHFKADLVTPRSASLVAA